MWFWLLGDTWRTKKLYELNKAVDLSSAVDLFETEK